MMPVPVALFDRLMGEPIDARESVKRELLRFFNTRADRLDDGPPEWSTVYAGDERAVQQFCRQLRDALLRHDPRISGLSIAPVDVHQQTLALQLTMTFRDDDAPLMLNIAWRHGGWR